MNFRCQKQQQKFRDLYGTTGSASDNLITNLIDSPILKLKVYLTGPNAPLEYFQWVSRF